MVFGLGAGSIVLTLNKRNFSPGEFIEGKVRVKLKKPVKARELSVSLIATMKTTEYSDGQASTETKTVFEFKQPLEGEKEYLPDDFREYDFRIKVPESAVKSAMEQLPPEMNEGFGRQMMQAVGSLIGARPLHWFVEAKLDVPMAFDIRKKIQVNI